MTRRRLPVALQAAGPARTTPTVYAEDFSVLHHRRPRVRVPTNWQHPTNRPHAVLH